MDIIEIKKPLLHASQFNGLRLFKPDNNKEVLHLPTDDYSIDIRFFVKDERSLKVNIYRYFKNECYSELQDSILISHDDFIENIEMIDSELSKGKKAVAFGCIWIPAKKARYIFNAFKKISIKNSSDQLSLI